ncbi:IS607 family element RNA-guided endonuclease TnpB [Streptomyces sp. NPDC096311]|uniref:IS607 family element RNA-guided endonuclease TnpB n=1 Tax=Streptomyces sp. NPDC096311 TaxID=3366083 RepID=UPI00381A981F
MKKFKPRPGFVVQAYRFALDPNAGQERALESHCGAARAAYNWAVTHVTASWYQRGAEETYGIPEEQLTQWRSWSLPVLRRAFNAAKRADPRFASWWEESSKEAYNTGLSNAAAAFDNYARSKNGKRKGQDVGVPRRKPKRTARLSCRFTTGTIRVEADGRHVTLPRLGTIRIHERADAFLRHLVSGAARVLFATVRYERGRWFVAFQVERKRDIDRVSRPDVVVGMDLGVKILAVLADSTGEVRHVDNPKYLDEAQGLLRHHNRRVSRRQGPDHRTGRKPSKRWEKANAERNKILHRVANLRDDAVRKLTAGVAAEYGTVVVEDLNVAGMLKNRRLARSVADAGFGEIRRHLTHKIQRNGCRLVVADRWYPSSKTCSRCGAVKAKLPLNVRVFECDVCGSVLDRDANAAHNLAALAASVLTGTGVAGDLDATTVASKPRGAGCKTRNAWPGRKTGVGRAGGEKPAQRGEESGDRRQGAAALTLW